MRSDREGVFREGLWVMRAVYPALPLEAELAKVLEDAEAAEARGYYLPDEDERVREVFRRYLKVRMGLWEMVLALRPLLEGEAGMSWERRLRVFGLAFCAAAVLVRSASFLVRLAEERKVVWRKLDEAEARYGIAEGSFRRIYRNLSSARWMWRYYEAGRFYELHREEIHRALRAGEAGEVADWLGEEELFLERKRRDFVRRKVRYRVFSFKLRQREGYRRVMFHFFKMGGSAVAEMRHPFGAKVGLSQPGKRVSVRAREELEEILRAGDVLVTRHDDAMSNLFLPGYWPHAALYLGRPDEREAFGLQVPGVGGRFLEAKKDGVLYRPVEETLAVDALMVLRPRLRSGDLAQALQRAVTHEGKLYDFVFDFRQADRLVCTEVVYRAYHGTGGMGFELSRRSGRLCLSAEDFIRQALARSYFELVACFGVGDNLLRFGEGARRRVAASLRKFGG
ncbi:MAG: YiiX/YebB-like N1pC/P60 family cysteine hydrolase [Verrucomicrobiales bacterium]